MPAINQDHEEKRNFIRMFVDAKVTITDPVSGQKFEGVSKNLSGDGVMFVSEKKFDMDQTLNVDIRSEQSKLSPLSAQFQVKRIRALDNGKFEVAGAIDSIK